MPSHVFQIETGQFGLQLVGTSDPPEWQTPGGVALDTATIAEYTDFTCQLTSGALTASPNTTDETTPATFCEPEKTTTKVGVTSYTVDVTFLQDPDLVQGLNRYLFQNDTLLAYFYLGLDGASPPKTGGRVRLIAGTIGGEARVTLTADLSLPCEQKPDVEFGDATTSEVVAGATVMATEFVAGTPGTVTPANATEPSTFAELTAAAPPVAANPVTAWTVGQYAQLPGTGTTVPGRVSWNGTAWVNTVAATTATTAGAGAAATTGA